MDISLRQFQNKPISIALALLVCTNANLAVQAQKSVSKAKGSSDASPSMYNALYEIARSLEFTGWKLARNQFFVESGGNFKNVIPSKLGNRFDPSKDAILKECGCHAFTRKVFKRGNRYVTFEGYQFNNRIGANAGYNFLRRGSTTVVKRGDASSEDSQSISFFQGNFFFRIFSSVQDDDEAKDVVTKIANLASNKVVSQTGPLSWKNILPSLDRVKGSEKIVLGPITARHYFSVPYIQELRIEKSQGAIVADYQVYRPHRERLKVLYVDYGNPVIAQRAYFNFASNLSQLKPPLSGGPDDSPRSLFKINKRYLLCELKPKGRIIVITGARKKNSPGVLARQI